MWENFAKKNKVLLYLCVSAALRRGVLENISGELQKDRSVIKDVFRGFHICGLSSVVEKLLSCDRFVQF